MGVCRRRARGYQSLRQAGYAPWGLLRAHAPGPARVRPATRRHRGAGASACGERQTVDATADVGGAHGVADGPRACAGATAKAACEGLRAVLSEGLGGTGVLCDGGAGASQAQEGSEVAQVASVLGTRGTRWAGWVAVASAVGGVAGAVVAAVGDRGEFSAVEKRVWVGQEAVLGAGQWGAAWGVERVGGWGAVVERVSGVGVEGWYALGWVS